MKLQKKKKEPLPEKQRPHKGHRRLNYPIGYSLAPTGRQAKRTPNLFAPLLENLTLGLTPNAFVQSTHDSRNITLVHTLHVQGTRSL